MANSFVVTFTPKFNDFITLYRGIERIWIGDGTTGEEGVLYAEMIDGVVQTIGPITGYYYAINNGFEGTFEEWVQLVIDGTQHALDAEGWAVGQHNGQDVAETDETYQNNSKWYALQSRIAKEASETAQTKSETAQSKAETAQLKAETAQSKAEAAQTKAETAHGKSEVAQAASETARDASITAKNASEAAKNASETARDTTETFKNSAEQFKNTASDYASEANQSKLMSEAWATGKRQGTDVPTTDATYHNNSKWYATQAELAKTSAENSQSAAASSAQYIDGVVQDFTDTVTSAVTVYQNSTDGTVIPDGEWTAEPDPTKGEYIWAKTIYTWQDGHTTESCLVAYTGMDGNDIKTITYAQIDALF